MSVKLNKISKDLMEAVKDSSTKGTQPYDTTATVVRVDGETAWVYIDGGVDETPVRKTIDCKAGDTIQIRVGGGDAWITGNVTAPPTDDTRTIKVEEETKKVAKGVSVIGKIANNTNQYFWHTESGTDTGAHITEIPRESFLKDPENGGGNLLARSNGIAVRDGLTELASFGANGSRIGTATGGHSDITDSGFVVSKGNDEVCSLGYKQGINQVGTVGYVPVYDFGIRKNNSVLGGYSLVQGQNNEASAFASSAFGFSNTSSGDYSVTMGDGNTASARNATSIGHNNSASAGYSTAIGRGNTVSGPDSVTIGYGNTASGQDSVVCGLNNNIAHHYIYAFGEGLISNTEGGVVVGKYNASNYSEFTVGCGNSGDRFNAFEVNPEGIYVGGKLVQAVPKSSKDFDDYHTTGIYWCTGMTANVPGGASTYALIVVSNNGETACNQIAVPNTGAISNVYFRSMTSGGFNSWKKVAVTSV